MSTEALHDIIADLKNVAIDLGHTPTYTEYITQGMGRFSERQLRKHFGGFSPALQAAGLSATRVNGGIVAGSIKEQIKSGFTKNPEDIKIKARKDFEPSQAEPHASHKNIVILGDTHFPFQDSDSIAQALEIIDELKPEAVIQMGDLYDMFSWSKFPKSADLILPKQEIEFAHLAATTMWQGVRKASPNAACYQLLGNHDVRPLKRLLEAYPVGALFFDIGRFFKFDGVHTMFDSREEFLLEIGGHRIAFIHGYKSKLGQHRDHMLINAVCGHSHRGGVDYRQLQGKTIWELNAGFLGGINEALSYTPQRMTNWTLGIGIVDHLGPRFVPL